MDGIVTKMLTISNGCKFENEMYSFSLNGKQYEPKKDAEKGITIEISNDKYTLVKEQICFDRHLDRRRNS